MRETTVVLVRKIERRIRSAREGREGEVKSGGSTARVRRRRWRWRMGLRERRRRWCDVCGRGVSPVSVGFNFSVVWNEGESVVRSGLCWSSEGCEDGMDGGYSGQGRRGTRKGHEKRGQALSAPCLP